MGAKQPQRAPNRRPDGTTDPSANKPKASPPPAPPKKRWVSEQEKCPRCGTLVVKR